MKTLALTLLAMASISSVSAENLQAANCQIYIRRLQASRSSQSSLSTNVIVKVSWLGNGEYIQRVGFYGRTSARDLGNRPMCSSSGSNVSPWQVQWGRDRFEGYGHSLEYGEYAFNFPIASGSVVSDCPGFDYSSSGSFFVETNVNTYWVNPALDPNEQFVFDANGHSILVQQAWFSFRSTDTEDMRYFNPASCR